MADRGINSKEEVDRILRPLLAGEHEQHQLYPDRRGYMRKDLDEIMGRLVADQHDEHNVFPDADQLLVVAPPRIRVPNTDEERLRMILALASAVGLPRQIEREALNTVIPATVKAGLVPTMGLVDNNDGSGPTLTSTLELHVAKQSK